MEDILGVLMAIGACLGAISYIFVLVLMFMENPFQAFLGFICTLYAFFWGWTNTEKHSLLPIAMIGWTAALGIFIIVQAITQYG